VLRNARTRRESAGGPNSSATGAPGCQWKSLQRERKSATRPLRFRMAMIKTSRIHPRRANPGFHVFATSHTSEPIHSA
jgi:hypothetical protein